MPIYSDEPSGPGFTERLGTATAESLEDAVATVIETGNHQLRVDLGELLNDFKEKIELHARRARNHNGKHFLGCPVWEDSFSRCTCPSAETQ